MHPFDPASLYDSGHAEPKEKRPWLISFADLLCIMLSFFVLLSTISRVEKDKTHHAMESLGSSNAFGGFGLATLKQQHQSNDEAMINLQNVRDQLSPKIHALFPMARMESVPAEDILSFTLPADAVFKGDELRPDTVTLLSNIAVAVRQGAPGYRFDVAAMIDRSGADGNPDSEMAAIGHASALARELIARGAPKTLVSAGLDRGRDGEVRITIHAHPDNEPRIDFHRVAG